MGHQSLKYCQAVIIMKLLIVLGLFPFLSSSPLPEAGGPFQSKNYLHDLGQVRNMAELLVTDLKALNADPNNARILSKIFKNDKMQCLRDMDDAILAIQEGTQLLENASSDIQSLVTQVENMIGMRDEAQIVRVVASIMRSLTALLTKISPNNPTSNICQSSPKYTFDYFRSLAVVLEELSQDPKLAVNPELNRMLVYSSSVVAGVTGFLEELSYKRQVLQNACTGDRLSGMRAISALGDLMLSLGNMVSNLDGNGKIIRDGKKITERIVAQLGIMRDFQGYFTCSQGATPNMDTAAAAMEDLASLIEEIGINNLQKELGIDMYSVFDFKN